MSICDVREKQRADNRLKYPQAAQHLDDLRELFGDDVRLTYAAENGRKVGALLGGYFMSVEQWRRLSAMIKSDRKRLGKK